MSCKTNWLKINLRLIDMCRTPPPNRRVWHKVFLKNLWLVYIYLFIIYFFVMTPNFTIFDHQPLKKESFHKNIHYQYNNDIQIKFYEVIYPIVPKNPFFFSNHFFSEIIQFSCNFYTIVEFFYLTRKSLLRYITYFLVAKKNKKNFSWQVDFIFEICLDNKFLVRGEIFK